jgi:hypothetical protein
VKKKSKIIRRARGSRRSPRSTRTLSLSLFSNCASVCLRRHRIYVCSEPKDQQLSHGHRLIQLQLTKHCERARLFVAPAAKPGMQPVGFICCALCIPACSRSLARSPASQPAPFTSCSCKRRGNSRRLVSSFAWCGRHPDIGHGDVSIIQCDTLLHTTQAKCQFVSALHTHWDFQEHTNYYLKPLVLDAAEHFFLKEHHAHA